MDDVFVPAAHTCSLADPPRETGPLYHPGISFAGSWTGTAANALGIARGAIDTFVELAKRKGTTTSATVLRDRPYIQTRLAEAEAILNAARAYVIRATSRGTPGALQIRGKGVRRLAAHRYWLVRTKGSNPNDYRPSYGERRSNAAIAAIYRCFSRSNRRQLVLFATRTGPNRNEQIHVIPDDQRSTRSRRSPVAMASVARRSPRGRHRSGGPGHR